MATFETIAVRLARCVDVLRDPEAQEAEEVELRALAELMAELPITIRVDALGMEVNGVACESEGLTALVQRLDLHGVSEIAFPPNPPPAQLRELLIALAEPPGDEDFFSRLRRAGVDRIHVALAAEPPRSLDAAPPAALVLGTEGILRGEALQDIASVQLSGVPLVTHDPPPPPAAQALPGLPAGPPLELVVSHELGFVDPNLRPPRAAPGPPPSVGAADSPPSSLVGPAPEPAPAPPGDALTELKRNPAAPNVDQVLALLGRDVEALFRSKRVEQGLELLLAIVRCEQRVPDGSSARRHYGIALRRVATKQVLEMLGQLVTVPKYREEAMLVLQRTGPAAVEILFDMLVAAPTASERRAFFDALAQMKRGTEQLIHAVDHPEWFVVRNVAELLGELGMEEAVPALSQQIDHADERVRKAVALALAKIGTRSAVEPLRRALHDRSPEVRIQVALGIGGPKSAALAMPLVVAAEEEKDAAVQRELILALGRIASPDAVQALIKCSQPAGRLFGRKATERRLAAVEALRLSATPVAVGTLEGLADDGDRQVRDAAREALAALGREPQG